MAVGFNPPSRLNRSTTGTATPFTVCMWLRPFAASLTGTKVPWYRGSTSFTGFNAMSIDSAVLKGVPTSGTPCVTGPTLTADQWIFAAMVVSGTSWTLYWRLEGATSLSTATGTGTPGTNTARLTWGASPDDLNAYAGAIAYGRLFLSALSSGALLTESTSATAVATEWADWPMADAATATADVSGNGRNLTAAGNAKTTFTPAPTIGLGLGATVGTVSEVDLARPVGAAKVRAVGLIAETDLARSVGTAKARPVGLIAETDLARSVGTAKARPVGLIAETDAAGLVGAAKVRAVGLIAETDVALAFQVSTPMIGLVSETDIVRSVGVSKARAVGSAFDVNVSLPVETSKIKPVGVVLEVDVGLAIEIQNGDPGGMVVALAYQTISMKGPYTQAGDLQTFVAPAAAAGDNTIPPDDRGWLEFENSNASARTVTINPPATAGLDQLGVAFPNMVYEIAATTGRRRIGPLDRRFADTDGLIHFTVSADTGVTCAALRI